LLAAAGAGDARAALAGAANIDPEDLDLLVARADLARVHGIGVVFARMLEGLGINDVTALAGCDPAALHAELRRYNRQEGLARRSPTPEEVAGWVAQARALPPAVT
jgi:predicted flap endonuclease-1-like 5' DNA nuclease